MSDKFSKYQGNLPEYIEDKEDFDLYKRRHSAEHVLMQAMMNLYGEDAILMAMGPATKDGFYFDFDTNKDIDLSEDDFKKIEKEMKKIIKQGQDFVREELNRDEAKEMFADNPYKLEWIEEIGDRDEKFTVYKNLDRKGNVTFVDLCKGPHVDNTKEIGSIKLLSIAGAYWRGDENNKMLTRIYGTAFAEKEQLKTYLNMLEEAKKRDHRKLGQQLGLFFISDLVGGGLNIWTPKGTIIRKQMDEFVWELRKAKGYQQVTIPHITKKDLYETSGHWEKFADELFRMNTREGKEFALKPMNCPHHTQIYDHEKRSYRDLPQRYTETTMVYRDEQSGELSGLSRVRCITQDDAHVFCRRSQVGEEFNAIWDIIENFYGAFDIPLRMRLSYHDPNQFEKYLGTPEIWQEAEKMLEELAKERGYDYEIATGEAAMYGPKTDFMGVDSLGREHQVATVQLDMNMPERFDLTCVNEEGEEERIVMIHAAIMGSIERFSSVMIEHLAGNFPAWLAPEQIKVLPISDEFTPYALEVKEVIDKHVEAKNAESRVSVDDRNETLQSRIRDAAKAKIPYILVVGQREQDDKKVAVRLRGERADIGTFPIEEFAQKFAEEVKQRKLQSVFS
jgi:threonyl-tRNA synthetase